MSLFEIVAILVSITALFSYLNFRFLKLPVTAGLMLQSLALSLLLILVDRVGLPLQWFARDALNKIDFHNTLMNGMLSSLLFAGALHVRLVDLNKFKLMITILSTFGLLISMSLIGGMVYYSFQYFQLPLSLPYALLFGALISPTDPIAVLNILKGSKAPVSIKTKIAGESLFNDGFGVVVFVFLSNIIALPNESFSLSQIAQDFAREAFGGAALGFGLGALCYYLLKSIDDYKTEILITIATVLGGYSLASALHTSGPIAMVVAGLILGNHGRSFAMSDLTRKNLDLFWEMIDETLNALLFVLIGLEFLVVNHLATNWPLAFLCIPIVLFARWISVAILVTPLRKVQDFAPHLIKILTWGGLRGGISIALVLSLPMSDSKEILLTCTYAVVVFSILGQGLTFKKMLMKNLK